MTTGALVLAGGSARRMGGQSKALLELDGTSFLRRLAMAFEPFEEKLLCGVYAKSCLPMLESALSGDRRRVMALFDAVGGTFLPLVNSPFPDELLTNVNTPEELAALIHR